VGLVDEVKNSILEMVDWKNECFSVLVLRVDVGTDVMFGEVTV
jgi:hypothetical protein